MTMDIYAQLTRDEGDRRHVYYLADPTFHQVPHVGIGHNLESGPPLSDAAVRQILEDDVAVVVADLDRLIPWWRTLSEPRQGVLLNMAFNMGPETLVKKNSRMLACLQAGDYEGTTREMLDGPWHIQVGSRSARLVQQMTSNQWV